MIASTFDRVYFATWGSAVAVGAALAVVRRTEVGLLTSRTVRFLAQPWKFATFAVATGLVASAGPYSGDPTWDLPVSLLVSALVFLLAPWAVGAAFRDLAVRGTFTVRTFAALVSFWVPCWAYDAYILLRDGTYPSTALPNLAVTGPITLMAGMFWNLGRAEGKVSVFAFRWRDWPSAARTSVASIAGPALLISLPVLLTIGAFVFLWAHHR